MTDQLKRDYEIGEEIGRGRFGVVHRCVSRATGEPFAVKSVDRSLLSDDLDRALAEMEPKLARLAGAGGNPGVVHVHAVYEDETWTHTVMDLCSGPDLLDWMRLRSGAPVPEPEAVAIVAQVAAALAHCHRHGVAHRDVKPENVLLDCPDDDGGGPAPRARLADFGSAAFVGGGAGVAEGLVGTPHYVAPEVVAGIAYGEKADVWSAGVVLYLLLSGGALPFVGDTPAEVLAAVLRGTPRFPPQLFAGVSPAAKDLMRRMLCRDVSRRLSAEQVLRHPWIESGGGAQEVTEPT